MYRKRNLNSEIGKNSTTKRPSVRRLMTWEICLLTVNEFGLFYKSMTEIMNF